MSFIESDLQEGDFVERGNILWKVGTSGVPEVGYDDFHLHFAIMENPYNYLKAGTYDFGDYMAWDWLTKGQSYEDTLYNSGIIFE